MRDELRGYRHNRTSHLNSKLTKDLNHSKAATICITYERVHVFTRARPPSHGAFQGFISAHVAFFLSQLSSVILSNLIKQVRAFHHFPAKQEKTDSSDKNASDLKGTTNVHAKGRNSSKLNL